LTGLALGAGLASASRGAPVAAGPADSSPLRFDPSTGLLAIRGDAGGAAVREALTPQGFLELTLGDQRHTSDHASASFDPALAGATGATLSAIRFNGGGQGTLVLGSQSLPGSLTVQAAGAGVVAQDVAVAGSLTISAPGIDVRGALHGRALTLSGPQRVTVEAGGVLAAGQGDTGGRIDVAAGVFVNAGQVHADGGTGGQVAVWAGNVLNAGRLTADGGPGGGGAVRVAFTGSYIDTVAARTSASGGAAGLGGEVTIDGGTTGRLFSSGSQQATGSVGGRVDLFGREVVLDGASVDASGEFGGGSIRVGGDYRGRNPAVADADTVTVTPASTLRDDALLSGAGGRVTVWADKTTAFGGAVSARGGAAGGAGGFIEVSARLHFPGKHPNSAPLKRSRDEATFSAGPE
jgi:hypothetical protein